MYSKNHRSLHTNTAHNFLKCVDEDYRTDRSACIFWSIAIPLHRDKLSAPAAVKLQQEGTEEKNKWMSLIEKRLSNVPIGIDKCFLDAVVLQVLDEKFHLVQLMIDVCMLRLTSSAIKIVADILFSFSDLYWRWHTSQMLDICGWLAAGRESYEP